MVQIFIRDRVAELRTKAADRYHITEDECHIGHIVLESMLERPDDVHQIDGATGKSETNISVANRSRRLASAMTKSGLKVGDHVVIIGNNHLNLCIPYFACHYNGYSMCAVDPMITLPDLTSLFHYINPKMVFCPHSKQEDVYQALDKNKKKACVHPFGEDPQDLEKFIKEHNGTKVVFKPTILDQKKTTCWLMMTSGTTGLPKVAIIPYETLLNGLCAWWSQFTEHWEVTLAMATIQWMSSLIFFVSAPLMKNIRLQSSANMTPQLLVGLINKYKPGATAWTPYLLGQFLQAAKDVVDLSSFKYIAIGGSAIEKDLYDSFSEKCSAYLYLVYGMTELLVPVFEFNKNTPFGSVGKPYPHFEYKIIGDRGQLLDKPNETGELWIKGDAFFKGYYNNPQETEKLLTSDGWLKTGDIFYRTEDDYYYFVERKRLLIKYTGFWISPLQLEEVINRHPDVNTSCVVGIPDRQTTETPVAAVVKKAGSSVTAQDIFDLIKKEMPEIKQVHGGLFFVDKLPETPSGKLHRAKIKDLALVAEKTYPEKKIEN
ncbi:AMP-binding enzyme domain-containing protein [Phthorimaea operculella]|nr:AMP-binding enzyme domain-containing protein [Phthorimaea operculella]